MDSKRRNRQVGKANPDGHELSDKSGQRDLWSAPEESLPTTPPRDDSTEEASLPRDAALTQNTPANHLDRKTIQDLLFREGLLAARLAEGVDSLEELQERLVQQLPQNSLETRTRYAQSVLKWFFPDGLSSLVPRVVAAYHDETVTGDVLRTQYLLAEPIVGACVAECLYPLDLGMRVPIQYLDRFLREHLGEEPPPRTRDRLKTNLMRLGFLGRSRGQPDQLLPVNPTPTATLVLVHSLFAPEGPRTVELRNLLAHPFWKYLGYKSEDAVRGVLRAADVAGLIGKYVVADQLEQVTTCLSFDELLTRRARL